MLCWTGCLLMNGVLEAEPVTDEMDVATYEAAAIWGGDDALYDIDYADNRMTGFVPTVRLSKDFDPFVDPPWHDGQGVSREGVASAIRDGRLGTKPYSVSVFAPDWTKEMHEERIAWLVVNPTLDPLEIEFSAADYLEMSIDDGNHRLAAAIYRGDELVPIQIGGFCIHCVEGLGVICRKFQRVATA